MTAPQGPVFDKQSSVCLLLSAESFYDCARLLCASIGNEDLLKYIPEHKNFQRPAIYANACRAIELGLKAYLRAAGDTAGQLRSKGGRNGHNIVSLLDAVNQVGLINITLTTEERDLFEGVSERYHFKDFDYPDVTFHRGAPSCEFAIKMAERIIQAVTPFCRQNDNQHFNRPSASNGFVSKR